MNTVSQIARYRQSVLLFFSAACIAGDARLMGEKFYQFTAIDEYSRFRYLAAFKDQSSYSASEFVKRQQKFQPHR